MTKEKFDKFVRFGWDVIDSGYCNKNEWYTEKVRVKKLNHAKGYKYVSVQLVKSDTKGLRMYEVWGGND